MPDKDKEYDLNSGDHELSEEELKRLQKLDAISTDESYDIDVADKINRSPPIKEEKIDISPPPSSSDKTFFEDINDKYTIKNVKEESPIIDKSELEPPVFEDTSKKTKLDNGEEEETDDREYLNRRETIFSEPPEMPINSNKQKNNIATNKKEKNKDYSSIATGFVISLIIVFIFFAFFVLWTLLSNKVTLSETEKSNIIEMSKFLAFNEEYIDGINELSDQKRTLLESYLKGVRNKKEFALDLLALEKKETDIALLFEENSWSFDSVSTAKGITQEYLVSNKELTSKLVEMLGSGAEKGQLLTLFNDSTTRHISQIYTLNEYVKSQVNALGVDVNTVDNIIQIDFTNVK